jgi:hypothetical protein
MKPAKFFLQDKHTSVEALQYRSGGEEDIREFCGHWAQVGTAGVFVTTADGCVGVGVGCWIVKKQDGMYEVRTDENFREVYR